MNRFDKSKSDWNFAIIDVIIVMCKGIGHGIMYGKIIAKILHVYLVCSQ